MKSLTLILLFVFFNFCAIAQKAMTFEQAKKIGIFESLDSRYQGGINSDTTKSVFVSQQDYIETYQNFLSNLGDFLKKNNFKWGKKVKCFNKIYFSKDGSVDYYLYNFPQGQVSKNQEVMFGKLVQKFIQKEKFGLTSNKRFSQCSPVIYIDF